MPDRMVWSPSLLTCRPPNHSDQRPSRTPSTRTSYRAGHPAALTPTRLPAPVAASWPNGMEETAAQHHAKEERPVECLGAGPVTPSGDEAEPAGVGHGFGTIGRPELVEDMAGVLLHRLQGDHQLGGDVAVAAAGGQQSQHLQLPGGQRLDEPGDD